MNIKFEQDLFAQKARGISKIYYEVLLLMKFLQTKPEVKNMNMIYYDLYYTLIKTRDDNEVVKDQYENDNDKISLNDVLIPTHIVGKRGREI